MQTKTHLQLPGGFYFLPNGDSLKGRIIFDLPVPIQHIQPTARDTKAAKNINNRTFGCLSEQLKAGSHGFPHVAPLGSWESDSDHITAPLCLITAGLSCSIWNQKGFVLRKMTWEILLR